jgi:hypothetical protein
VHEFLTLARRPSFDMLAPGLRVPTSAAFVDQPCKDSEACNERCKPPILLFPLDHEASSDHRASGWPEDLAMALAGLYLNQQDGPHDECTFVMPFEMGKDVFAATGDGKKFSSTHGPYQPGYLPWCGVAERTLVSVLESWRAMVVRGHWDVHKHGVKGGMEKGKEANEEETWERYVMPVPEG